MCETPFLSNCQVWTLLEPTVEEYLWRLNVSDLMQTNKQNGLDFKSLIFFDCQVEATCCFRSNHCRNIIYTVFCVQFVWSPCAPCGNIPTLQKACKSSELDTLNCPLTYMWIDLCLSVFVLWLASGPFKMSWCTPYSAYCKKDVLVLVRQSFLTTVHSCSRQI